MTLRAQTLAAHWNVDRPKEPSGNATIEATQVVAQRLRVRDVRLSSRRHAASQPGFRSDGLAARDSVPCRGLARWPNWSGNMQRLKLELKDAARLALQRPVPGDVLARQRAQSKRVSTTATLVCVCKATRDRAAPCMLATNWRTCRWRLRIHLRRLDAAGVRRHDQRTRRYFEQCGRRLQRRCGHPLGERHASVDRWMQRPSNQRCC